MPYFSDKVIQTFVVSWHKFFNAYVEIISSKFSQPFADWTFHFIVNSKPFHGKSLFHLTKQMKIKRW